MLKISQRKRYIKKQKRDTTSSKDDELDLLGDDVDSLAGSQADLESAADNLFTSPHVLSPYPLKHQQRLSHPPQVLTYSRKLNQIYKNPWVTHLTSIYSSKWVHSRHLC